VLHVHHAEGGRALVDGLADLLSRPHGDPLTPEVVAVPARGIERWIAQRLSHRLGAGEHGDGVCAHVAFPRPDALLDDAVAAASPEHDAAVRAWASERVVWSLLDVLDACPDEQWCAGLRHHIGLDGPAPRLRRYAVARRLTGLFASYASARPALLRGWAAGDDAGVPGDLRWQPELWRRLREAVGGPSPAELLDDGCAALREHPDRAGLPERVSLYGPSRIAPARLQVLAALAEHRDVHLWLHVASPALWEACRGVPPPRRRAEADASVRPRHPLLASLSRDVRELQLRLSAVAPGHVDTHHPGADREPRSLLQRLQSDLRSDSVPAAPFVVEAGDRSVQVHACHGRARQVEVLREAVLGLLADDPSLEPRDVLVMCPDVEAYAPLVAAAFGTDSHPGGRLRVALADRSPRQVNPLLGVAAALLELAGSRVTATQVLDLAGRPPVRRRFRFDDDALERLRGWTVSTGVRWGLDAEHRAPWRMQLPDGTWRAGLDRLLTGVAMQESGALLGGVLPLDDVESSDVDLAGRTAELLDRLGAALHRLQGPQTAVGWLGALEDSVLALADVAPDSAWQLAQLRRELGEVRAAAATSTAELSLGDATALLQERLAGRPSTTSFRTGGLTVCTLTPMRSVPHRVVCLLGLDDGAFPRHGAPDGDDLLARDPHLGERDPRSEDRQLLLDALMAAGEHLVVTYAGADVRTGAELAPAVPLGELLDALDATAVTADRRPARTRVVVRHPLQPFDARNFLAGELGRPGPLSFDTSALAGARSAAGPRQPVPAFLAGSLPAGEVEPDVDLGRLAEFLQHPARGFLRQRLDVVASTRDEEPDDALPVELDALQQWQVGDRVLQARLRGTDADDVKAVETARGGLPPGPLGAGLLGAVGRRVDRLVVASEPYRTTDAATVDVEVGLPGRRRLLGSVRGVRGDCVLTVTYSTVRAKQRLRAWVELLALAAVRPEAAVRAVVVGRGPRDTVAVVTLGPVSPGDALEHLAELAAVRDAGLRAVLPLPVGAGEAYAASRARGGKVGKAWYAGRKEWESGFRLPREDADAEHLLVWGDRVPFDALHDAELGGEEPGRGYASEPTAFARLARRVWQPLLDHEHVSSR
jgi:exodeoxyribonuclease V gamma subunit